MKWLESLIVSTDGDVIPEADYSKLPKSAKGSISERKIVQVREPEVNLLNSDGSDNEYPEPLSPNRPKTKKRLRVESEDDSEDEQQQSTRYIFKE